MEAAVVLSVVPREPHVSLPGWGRGQNSNVNRLHWLHSLVLVFHNVAANQGRLLYACFLFSILRHAAIYYIISIHRVELLEKLVEKANPSFTRHFLKQSVGCY